MVPGMIHPSCQGCFQPLQGALPVGVFDSYPGRGRAGRRGVASTSSSRRHRAAPFNTFQGTRTRFATLERPSSVTTAGPTSTAHAQRHRRRPRGPSPIITPMCTHVGALPFSNIGGKTTARKTLSPCFISPLAPVVVLGHVVQLDEQPVDLGVDGGHPRVHADLVLRQQEPHHLFIADTITQT